MKTINTILVLFCISLTSYAQEPLLINAYNRTSTTLNGDWNYIVDPYENGYYNYRYEAFDEQKNPSKNAFFTHSKPNNPSELVEYDFDKMPTLQVPGDWNTQDEKLFYYEGTVWYKKSFDYAFAKASHRAFIYFGAANYKTEVYLNGKKLGVHIGGFTPFNFEVTDILKPKDNFLIVKVDNKRIKEGVPTLNTDWWNYGGITRDVKLVETTATFIQDYLIQLDPTDTKKISGFLSLDGSNKAAAQVQINIPELNIKEEVITDQQGRAFFEISLNTIDYWSPDNPKLYEVFLRTNEEAITDHIGFRSIQTRGKQILLNGQPIFLKGISIHEESPITGGRSATPEDAKQLLLWAKELGCNYVRLAHYPHNEYMIRMADQMGIVVWEENPVYWTIDWDNEETYANAQNQLSEVIDRDKNRASVMIWSMANETPTSTSRNTFLNKLAKFTRAKDPTRLISAALEQSDYKEHKDTRTISDPFAEVVDILSFNQYIGWYDGLVTKTSQIRWKIEQDKPVIISEFGAGAKYGHHGDKGTRWTEEYQEHLYIETLKMLEKIEQLQGISPWILVDFRSPRRVLPSIQDNWNRKGLISEKGEKKKAFFILRDFYNTKTPR